MKLGKRPPPPAKPQDFKVAALAAVAPLPVAPLRFGHGSLFKDWGALGNDRVGNCVLADAAHQTMLTNKLRRKVVAFTEAGVISDYSAVAGYVPGQPDTDVGTVVRDALSYRRKTGVVDANGVRHKIGAYVQIDPNDFDLLMQAVYVFTSVSVGFNFPETAWAQFDQGKPWDVVDPNADIDGGHDVPIVGRSSRAVAGCISWGRRVGMTRLFYETYNDEAFAIIFPEELRDERTSRGYPLATLRGWLRAID